MMDKFLIPTGKKEEKIHLQACQSVLEKVESVVEENKYDNINQVMGTISTLLDEIQEMLE